MEAGRWNSNLWPSPVKSSRKKVATKLFILQGRAELLSSAPVWAGAQSIASRNAGFRRIPTARELRLSGCGLEETLQAPALLLW
jgi:hypothetical protein